MATAPGQVEAGVVAIVSRTAAGARSSTTAVPPDDEAALAAFGARIGDQRLVDRVTRVVARTDVPAGQSLWGAVVSVGCDVSPGVVVTTGDEGVEITPQAPTAPLRECLVPITSVALVLVPDGP